LDPAWCSLQPKDMVRVGHKVAGTPGVQNAAFLRDLLDYYIDNSVIARMILYDDIVKLGKGNAACSTTTWENGEMVSQKGNYYVVEGFGAFRITGYNLAHANPNASNTRDDPDYLPETCLDYPKEEGSKCCYYWDECTGNEDPACDYFCTNWVDCDYNTGKVNRITGVFEPWTEEGFETCEAVGNFWAPRLTK
jgi:hypothetical protein